MKVDLRHFKSMLKKIRALGVEDSRMTVGNSKLHSRVVDPAHVALLDMELKIEGYNKPRIDFALALDKLWTRIYHLPVGRLRKDDPENKLTMKLSMEKGFVRRILFSHPMLTFNKKVEDIAGIPETRIPKGIIESLQINANINTLQLKKFLKIAEEETDHISFIAERKNNTLRAEFINDDGEIVSTPLSDYSLGGIEGINLKFLKYKLKTTILNILHYPTHRIYKRTRYRIGIYIKHHFPSLFTLLKKIIG